MSDQLRNQVINALVEARVAGVDGSIINSQAHEVAAVVAPLLADRDEAVKLIAAERDEATAQLVRDATAYRDERDNAITVGDRLGWRLVEAQQEVARLRREVEFEANGADTFAGADELHDEAVNRG